MQFESFPGFAFAQISNVTVQQFIHAKFFSSQLWTRRSRTRMSPICSYQLNLTLFVVLFVASTVFASTAFHVALLRHIHAHAVVVHFHDGDRDAVFQRAQLLQLFRRLRAATPGTSPTATTFPADNRKCPDASKKETPPTVRSPNHWRLRADTESCAGKNIRRGRRALTTTFTTFGLSYSAGLRIGVAAVDISAPPVRRRRRRSPPDRSAVHRPGCSRSHHTRRRAATSAMRSEPLG